MAVRISPAAAKRLGMTKTRYDRKGRAQCVFDVPVSPSPKTKPRDKPSAMALVEVGSGVWRLDLAPENERR